MKLDTFAVPFTADRRMAYAAAYREQCSYRQVEEVQAADFVLLPVPAKADQRSRCRFWHLYHPPPVSYTHLDVYKRQVSPSATGYIIQ